MFEMISKQNIRLNLLKKKNKKEIFDRVDLLSAWRTWQQDFWTQSQKPKKTESQGPCIAPK